MSVEAVRQERAFSEAPSAAGLGASRWFAVKAQPRREELAELRLKKQGFEAFAPKVLTARRASAPRGKATLTPLLLGYLFVRLDLGVQRWRAVSGTIGVSQLDQLGDASAAAPHELIENLRARIGADWRIHSDEDLTVADSVRNAGGAFEGWIARLKDCDVQGRVAVLLEAFATQVPLRFPRESKVRAA